MTPTTIDNTDDDGLTPEQRRELQGRLEKIGIYERTTSFARTIFLLLAATGAGVAVYTTPKGVKNLVTTGKWAGDPGPSAKEQADRAPEEARKIMKEILLKEAELEMRTIEDPQVRARVERILADKNVSADEVWDLFITWQETELLKNSRRHEVLTKNPKQASDPAVLAVREKRLHAVALNFGAQISNDKGGPMAGRWRQLVSAVNGNDEKAAAEACREMQKDLSRYVSFSADVIATTTQRAGMPLNATGLARVTEYERVQVELFATERHELIGQAETFRTTLKSFKTLGTQHKRWTAKMAENGVPSKTGAAEQVKIDAHIARIDAQMSQLAKVMTVIELRNQAINDADRWQAAADAAVNQYFAGNVPRTPSDVSAALRLERIRATDRLRAEMNNETEEWIEAEVILRGLAYTIDNRGDDNAVMRQATDFLKKTEKNEDPKVKKVHDLVKGVVSQPQPTLQHVREAYGKMAAEQDLAIGRKVVDRVVEWAGAHKASIEDLDLMKDEGARKRIAKSRIDCAKAAVETLQEALLLRMNRNRWQSGYSAVQTGVNAQGRDTDILLDPQVGDIEADQRRQADKGRKDFQGFLGELSGEHQLKEVDLRRDAASTAVSWIRSFINVLDKMRGQPGQNTPHSIKLSKIVSDFDTQPLKDLEQRCQTLIAALEHPDMRDTKKIAEDRRATRGKEDAVARLRAELRKQNLTPESVLEMLKNATPEQRIALRMALEDRQRDAVEPFLTEEMTNLLKLAAYSTEGSGWVGELAESKDSWWNTLIFVLGVLAAYKGAKWAYGTHRHLQYVRALRRMRNPKAIDAMAEMGMREQMALTNAMEATSPDGLEPVLTDVRDSLDRIESLESLDHAGAEKKKKLAAKLTKCAKSSGKHVGRMTTNGVPHTLQDQVRLRYESRPVIEGMLAKVSAALGSASARRGDKPDNGSLKALKDMQGALQRLQTSVAQLESELPPGDPTLESTDLDTANLATLMVLAYKEKIDADRPEAELRDALREKKTPPSTPAE